MAYDFQGLYRQNRAIDFGWSSGTFDRVRIRLFKWEPSPAARERVASINVFRGD